MAKRGATKTKEKRYSIFFSYSTKDVGLAKLLIEKLELLGGEHGIDVFLDERSIEGGESIPERIRASIEGCDEFLVLLSADSIKSDWVKIEISAAWAHKKTIIAIVFKVTPEQALPIIAQYKAIKLERFKEEYLEQLIKRVKVAKKNERKTGKG